MKTLLYIHLGVSVISFILYIFAAIYAKHEFKRRYPDLKFSNGPLIDRIGTYFRALLCHFIPILNIFLIFTYLFRDEELSNKVVAKMYSSLSEEVTNDGT